MKKRYLLLGSVLVVAFSMAVSCSFAEERPKDFNIARWKGIEITVGMPEATMEWIRGLTPEFEKMTGIKVNLEGPSLGEFQEMARLDLVSGSPRWDILQFTNGMIGEFIGQGDFCEPLEPYINDLRFPDPEIDDFPLTLLQMTTYKGKIYGFPITVDLGTLFYNSAMYKEAGLTGVPTTPDELYEYARKLTKDTSGDGKIDQYGYALIANKDQQNTNTFGNLFTGHGGKFFDEQWRPQFNSEAGIQALKETKRMLDVSPPGVTAGASVFDVFSLQLRGSAAMMMGWAAWLPYYENPAFSSIVGKIRMAVPPLGRPRLGGWMIAIPRATSVKKKEAGFLFMDWIMNRKTDKQFTMQYGNVPYRLSTYADKDVQEKYPGFTAIRKGLKGAVLWPAMPRVREMTLVLNDLVHRVFIGELTAEQAMEMADEKIYAIVKEIGLVK